MSVCPVIFLFHVELNFVTSLVNHMQLRCPYWCIWHNILWYFFICTFEYTCTSLKESTLNLNKSKIISRLIWSPPFISCESVVMFVSFEWKENSTEEKISFNKFPDESNAVFPLMLCQQKGPLHDHWAWPLAGNVIAMWQSPSVAEQLANMWQHERMKGQMYVCLYTFCATPLNSLAHVNTCLHITVLMHFREVFISMA